MTSQFMGLSVSLAFDGIFVPSNCAKEPLSTLPCQLQLSHTNVTDFNKPNQHDNLGPIVLQILKL